MIVIASDKFKGSLSSMQVGEALRAGLKQRWPEREVLIFPMADGGDGFDEVMDHYFSLEKIEAAVVDPLGRPLNASWRWDAQRQTAYISVSAASALVQLKEDEKNPGKTSTYGTGLLIKDALQKGARHIVLGLGGSATNDAGVGILAALGFSLLNYKDEKIEPVGDNLAEIARIQPPAAKIDVVFNISCDVENPLFGENGAAFVYGPQKGADDVMVKRLDEGLRSVSQILSKDYGSDISGIPGLGAAGGIAAGLLPYFKVNINSGIDMVLEASGLKEKLKHASLVITGEGKFDSQSLQGKVVGRLAELCRKENRKCVVVCGISELTKEEAAKAGLQDVIAIRDFAKDDKESTENASELLKKVAAEWEWNKSTKP